MKIWFKKQGMETGIMLVTVASLGNLLLLSRGLHLPLLGNIYMGVMALLGLVLITISIVMNNREKKE